MQKRLLLIWVLLFSMAATPTESFAGEREDCAALLHSHLNDVLLHPYEVPLEEWHPNFAEAFRVYEFREAERILLLHGEFNRFFDEAKNLLFRYEFFFINYEQTYARLTLSLAGEFIRQRRLQFPVKLSQYDPYDLKIRNEIANAVFQQFMAQSGKRFDQLDPLLFSEFKALTQRFLREPFRRFKERYKTISFDRSLIENFYTLDDHQPHYQQRVWMFPNFVVVTVGSSVLTMEMNLTREELSEVADIVESHGVSERIGHRWRNEGNSMGPNSYEMLKHLRNPDSFFLPLGETYDISFNFSLYDETIQPALRAIFEIATRENDASR